ncbi:MAG: RNA polymerase sigma factor [Lacisediminihabitans sp.]
MASDAELIGCSLAGDREAFVGVIVRHEAAIGAYLVRRVGREAAEDMLSEVWLAAFTSRNSYDRSFPDARPWLFGVARNMLRRHWRSVPPEDSRSDVAELGAAWDPWTVVENGLDTHAMLRSALMRLRPSEREVLFLVAWEDLSVVDAARVLGIPSGSAYRHLHQARLELRSSPGMEELMSGLDLIKESK